MGRKPHGPVEGRQRERHLRVAVGIGLQRAGIDGERRFRERPAAHLEAAFVAAGADHAAHALHAVDELAVKVAHLKPEAALTEEIGGGRGRLVARDVQDAEIDARDDERRVLARIEARNARPIP